MHPIHVTGKDADHGKNQCEKQSAKHCENCSVSQQKSSLLQSSQSIRATLAIGGLVLASALSGCKSFSEGAISLSTIARAITPQPTEIPVGTRTITLNWSPNRETLVNSTGGGYRVYYDVNPTLTGSTPNIDVPYVSGANAPTTTQITNIGKARYYIHVIAYSSLNPTGSTATAYTVDVP
jgi:hypothetical protein